MTRRWRWWWKRVGWLGTLCGGLTLGAWIALYLWMSGFYVTSGQYQEMIREVDALREEWVRFHHDATASASRPHSD